MHLIWMQAVMSIQDWWHTVGVLYITRYRHWRGSLSDNPSFQLCLLLLVNVLSLTSSQISLAEQTAICELAASFDVLWLEGWNCTDAVPATDPCFWTGGHCSETHGGIDTIDISYRELSGKLPDSIGNLSSLSALFANDNSLTGTIPASMGLIPALVMLDLSTNWLTGTIPPSLGSSGSLSLLLLPNNTLTGTLPFGLLARNLTYLNVQFNYLTGEGPFEVAGVVYYPQLLLSEYDPSSHPFAILTSSYPSGLPTFRPSSDPSSSPSGEPSEQPSSAPTERPSRCPSGVSSSHPTNKPTDDIQSNIIVFVAMICYFLAAVFDVLLLVFLDRRAAAALTNKDPARPTKKSQSPRNTLIHDTRILNLLDSLLPVQLSEDPWYVRWYTKMIEEVEFYVFLSKYDPVAPWARHEKWMMTIIGFLNYMFLQAVLAVVIYPDDGTCQEFLNQADCEADLSPTLLHTQCVWLESDSICELNPPKDNILAISLLALFTEVGAIPMDYVIETFLISKLSSSVHIFSGMRLRSSKRVSAVSPTTEMLEEGNSVLSNHEYTEEHSGTNTVRITSKGITKSIFEADCTIDNNQKKIAKDCLRRSLYLSYRKHKLIQVDAMEPLQEVQWICAAAKKTVLTWQNESNLCTVMALRREFLKTRLWLDFNGNIRRSKENSLKKQIEESRSQCKDIALTLENILDEHKQNKYLVKHFIIARLPIVLKHFAKKHFFSSDGRYFTVDTAFVAWLRLGILVLYTIGLCLYIILFGVRYGSVSTISWAIGVSVNIAADIFLIYPSKIFFFHIIVPGIFIEEVQALLNHLKLRYPVILTRCKGLNRPEEALVQHLNPACRAARLFPDIPMGKLLLSVNDFDMPLFPMLHGKRGYGNLFSYLGFAVVVGFLSFIFVFIPEVVEDIIVEMIINALIPGLAFLFVFLMARIVYLPFVALFLVTCLLIYLEFHNRKTRERERLRAATISIHPELLKRELIGAKGYSNGRYKSAPVFVKNPRSWKQKLKREEIKKAENIRICPQKPYKKTPDIDVSPKHQDILCADIAAFKISVADELPLSISSNYHRTILRSNNQMSTIDRLKYTPQIYSARESVGGPPNIQFNQGQQNRPTRLVPLDEKLQLMRIGRDIRQPHHTVNEGIL